VDGLGASGRAKNGIGIAWDGMNERYDLHDLNFRDELTGPLEAWVKAGCLLGHHICYDLAG
jgi:hypothetical protein